MSMRTFRKAIKICIGVCLFAMCLMIIINFDLIKPLLNDSSVLSKHFDSNSKISVLLYDISLGVFSSSFVVFLTYIGAYNIEKKHVIGKLLYYCEEYIKINPYLVCRLISPIECKKDLNWVKIKIEVLNDDTHNIITQLLKIHDKRLLDVPGFHPFCRKNDDNLQVCKLIRQFAKINEVMQYCDWAYNINKNPIYASEAYDYSDSKFQELMNILLRRDEKHEYQTFLNLYNSVEENNPSKSIHNSNFVNKCS